MEYLRDLLWVLGAVGALGGMLGATLNSYGKISGFYIWLVANAAWVIIGMLTKQWWLAIQFGFLWVLAVNGIVQWRRKGIDA